MIRGCDFGSRSSGWTGFLPLLAWIDRPFVIEEPAALRDHVQALAERLLRSAGIS